MIGDSLEALLAATIRTIASMIVPVTTVARDDTRAIINRMPSSIRGRSCRCTARRRHAGQVGGDARGERAGNGRDHHRLRRGLRPGPAPAAAARGAVLRSRGGRRDGPRGAAQRGTHAAHAHARPRARRRLPGGPAGAHEPAARAAVWRHGRWRAALRAARASAAGTVDSLAEDTDLTFRLLPCGLGDRVPEPLGVLRGGSGKWPVRIRQIQRWAEGHNQALREHVGRDASRRASLPPRQVFDGLLLLGVFVVPLVLSPDGSSRSRSSISVRRRRGARSPCSRCRRSAPSATSPRSSRSRRRAGSMVRANASACCPSCCSGSS